MDGWTKKTNDHFDSEVKIDWVDGWMKGWMDGLVWLNWGHRFPWSQQGFTHDSRYGQTDSRRHLDNETKEIAICLCMQCKSNAQVCDGLNGRMFVSCVIAYQMLSLDTQ